MIFPFRGNTNQPTTPSGALSLSLCLSGAPQALPGLYAFAERMGFYHLPDPVVPTQYREQSESFDYEPTCLLLPATIPPSYPIPSFDPSSSTSPAGQHTKFRCRAKKNKQQKRINRTIAVSCTRCLQPSVSLSLSLAPPVFYYLLPISTKCHTRKTSEGWIKREAKLPQRGIFQCCECLRWSRIRPGFADYGPRVLRTFPFQRVCVRNNTVHNPSPPYTLLYLSLGSFHSTVSFLGL